MASAPGLAVAALAAAALAGLGAASAAAAKDHAPSALLDPSLAEDDECHGTDKQCALQALQVRRSATSSQSGSSSGAGCHTAVSGDACWQEIGWAKDVGMVDHPDWYSPHGLTRDSPNDQIQAFVHDSHPDKCPRPCGVAKAREWCMENSAAPTLWAAPQAEGQQIKVLSYNLFWWNLYGVHHGAGESAGHLIKDAGMFDVMGFQECEDPARVLQPVGLIDKYQVFLGQHAVCMAFNKDRWSLLGNGTADVAEDMPTRYYGRRGTQWMRLQSRTSGTRLFFMNHHGPLSVNSGGTCGGQATAHNLLQVMAKQAQVGDALVLVGDFNANAASLTIQTLWGNLVQAFVGRSFGGVDNMFSNVGSSSVVDAEVLGSGGSDHDAITATLRLDPPAGESSMEASSAVSAGPSPVRAVDELTGEAKPGHSWQKFWCGQIEDGVEYAVDYDGWWKSVTGSSAVDPEHCCRECQATQECQSWVWKDFSESAHGKECVLSATTSPGKKDVDGFVSGLAYTASARLARQSAAQALTHM